jgi:hypothetical protein
MNRNHATPARLLSVVGLGLGLGLNSLAPTSLPGQAAPGFVHETAAEFQTWADVNGDGFPDLVIAHKATGQFRIAAGAGDGSLTWRINPGHSGLGAISGFSSGPILQSSRDALLFTAPLANRIQIIDTPSDSRLTEPTLLPGNFVGPTVVTAINLPAGEAGYTADLLDVVYHATLHGPTLPNVVSHLRNDGSGPPFAEFAPFGAPGAPHRANRVRLEAGAGDTYAVMTALEFDAVFHLYDTSKAPIEIIDSAPDLPLGTAYVYADFNQDGLAQFLFFTPGSETLHESQWGGGLTSLQSFTYPTPVHDLRVIESGGRPELLIIHDGGMAADRVTYESGGILAVLENIAVEAGARITGALSLGPRLHLLTGDESGLSRAVHTYEFDGNQHQLIDQQTMTPLATGAGSSVLLFDAPPLTRPDARLLARLDAGPWTSAFSLSGGQAGVVSERFRGTTDGLGDEEAILLASTPVGTAGGLTNQTSADLSLRFGDDPIGRVTAQLRIEPGSGTYQRAFRPELTLNGGPATIFYRTDQQPNWTPYGSNPPVITTDTTLYAVATIGGNYSNVVQATYTFPADPGRQDSNGNGLPDFVALAYGLDPLAPNHDSDGDGFTDLQEVLAGTDPNDGSSRPARGDVAFEFPNSFNLVASPAIPNPGGGVPLLRSFPANAGDRPTELTVHQPNGLYLGSARTESTPLLPHPAATFNALDSAHPDLFVIATTETNFPIHDGSPKEYGRQVAAIVRPPAQAFAPFVYQDFGALGGYDDLPAEAAAWRTAALAYHQGLVRPTVTADSVGPGSTLVLLLVEKILGQALLERELTDRSHISLTPFRSNESVLAPHAMEETPSERRRAVSSDQLLALQRSSGTAAPSYKVHQVIQTVQDALQTAASPNIEGLVELARRLYTTSATSTTPGSLRQPLDALRRLAQVGHLGGTGYQNAPASANFPSALVAEAVAGIAEIAALVQPRTVETIDILYPGGPIDPTCPVWNEVIYTPGSFDPDSAVVLGANYELIDDQGRPFPIARAFPLTAGSVFTVTGFIEPSTACGDVALEVIPQPTLTHLRHAPAQDLNGDLIPDAIQNLLPGVALSPFGDSDGNGYSDLQEILSGSDPSDPNSIPLVNGLPAPILDLSPPRVRIQAAGTTATLVSFDFPQSMAPYIQFELYSSDDLRAFHPTGLTATPHSGDSHQLTLGRDAEAEFYLFRMKLK